MLADGFTTRRGRARRATSIATPSTAQLRGRRGARLTAITSGGTIPDTADYQVVLEPQAHDRRHGQRGLRGREPGRRHLPARQHLVPHPARRARPRARRGRARRSRRRIPFWLGEAPGRSDELSVARVAPARGGRGAARRRRASRRVRLAASSEVGPRRSRRRAQLVDYLAARAAPRSARCRRSDAIVLERFFDESGGMQLVIHSPFGSRINRAWGLALRKRFCRTFNFELQAAATEDAIVLSLVDQPQLPARRKSRATCIRTPRAHVLVQALLDAPMFAVRWRWNATTALALPRFARRQEGAAAAAAHEAPRTCSPRSSPTRSRAPRTSSASARSPIIRWSRRRMHDCLRRGDGHRRAGCALLRAHRGRRDRASSRATSPSPRRSPPRC